MCPIARRRLGLDSVRGELLGVLYPAHGPVADVEYLLPYSVLDYSIAILCATPD